MTDLLTAGRAGSPTRTSAAGSPVVIRFGHHHPPGSQVDRYSHAFADLLRKKTNGQADVQIFPSAQLGAEADAVRGVQQGVLQMTVGSSPFMDSYVKEIGTEQLPFLFDSWEQALKLFEGPLAVEMNKRLLANTNTRPLAWLTLGWRNMYFRNKRVTHLADMKGLKVRAPQVDFYVRMFELLGSKPVIITFSEIYTALQSGVADGVEQPLQTAIDSKFYEICKYGTLDQHMFASITHWINKSFYQNLPADVQTAVDDAARETAHTMNPQYRQDEQGAQVKLQSLGMTFDKPVDRDAWKAAMKPLLTDWVAQRPGAQSLIDIIHSTK